VLVSHNEDTNITHDFSVIANHPLLIHWFAQNVLFDHPKVTFLPIGLANSMWPHGNIHEFSKVYKEETRKEDLLYFYFSVHTNRNVRQECKDLLVRKGFRFGKQETYTGYLKTLQKTMFAICPDGNGIDSHRIWECL
jgi:hypothetical protein